MKAPQQMLPYPRKRNLRLPRIEPNLIIAEQIQIKMPPLRRALLDEQKSFEVQRDAIAQIYGQLLFFWQNTLHQDVMEVKYQRTDKFHCHTISPGPKT